MTASLLAIDPGSAKCGVAIVEESGAAVLERAIVPTADLVPYVNSWIAQYLPRQVIIGRGTHGARLVTELAKGGIVAVPVDETGTTLAARRRYYEVMPPRGWRRLLPRGLLVPPEPIDDWATVMIAERHLAVGQKKIF